MPPSAPDARLLTGCLLLILLSVSPSMQASVAKKEKEKESQITSILQPQVSIGQKIQVPCVGNTIYPESGIMYWLANGTFVDQLYPNGTVKEEATKEEGNMLTRELIFFKLTMQDVHTTFDCLITDPSGVFQKTIRWGFKHKKERNWTPLHSSTRELASPGMG